MSISSSMLLLEKDSPVSPSSSRRWSLSDIQSSVASSKNKHTRRRYSDLSSILDVLPSCPEEEEEEEVLSSVKEEGDGASCSLTNSEEYINKSNKSELPPIQEEEQEEYNCIPVKAHSFNERLSSTVSSLSLSCTRQRQRHKRTFSLISISSILASMSSPSSSSTALPGSTTTATQYNSDGERIHTPHRDMPPPKKSALRSPALPIDNAQGTEYISLDESTSSAVVHDNSEQQSMPSLATGSGPSTSTTPSISTTDGTVTPLDSAYTASTSNSLHTLTPSARERRASSSQHGYVNRVSFDDTHATGGGGGTGFEQSYTLRSTTANFIRTRESRTFLVATDMNEYSMHALNWAVDSLIEDGDELVVLRVLDPSTSSTSFTKSSLSDLAKEEAHHLLRLVAERNSTFNSGSTSTNHFHSSSAHEISDSHGNISIDSNSDLEPINEIGITIEHVIGRVQDSIQKVIKVYRPDSLIVGTRGRSDSLLKSAFIGSVSRYCVANSPVPTIVIRPTLKVRKQVNKRDGRQTYLDLVEGSSAPEQKVSTGLGMPRSSTLPTGRGNGSGGGKTSRSNSPSRPKSSNGPLGKIGAPLMKTKTLS